MLRHSVFCLVATAGLIMSPQAGAQAPVQAYMISSKASGLPLTVHGNPQTGYVLVQEPFVLNHPGQRWVFEHNVDGSFRIVNPCTGLALEMVNGEPRTTVALFPSRAVPTQNWYGSLLGGTNHYFFWPALHPDRFLDVPGAATHVTMIQIYKPNYSPAQLWNLIPIQ